MITKQITFPVLNLVDIDQALEHSRITDVQDEGMVTMALESAHSLVQQWLNRKLTTTLMSGFIPNFKSEIILPYPPIQSIQSVLYDNELGVQQTLPITYYNFNNIIGSISFKKDLSSYSNFIINYTCGYISTVCPNAVKHAIRMTFATLYEMREDALTGTQINSVPITAKNIIKAFRARSSK